MVFYAGQIVGSYQVLDLLGQGGMATVYKAKHTKLDRYVALKVMLQSFMTDPSFVARFEREAQIIARLEHPNIVPVHDYAEHEGTFYLVMKYIEGITLSHALGDGALELKDIRKIMAAITSALDYAHAQGVLHRDIKPSNIMLDMKATPYLSDFGLARTVHDGESSISQGMMIGTPTYMAPEQALGDVPIDSRADIYSLGVVLYQLLVGKVPFEGGSAYTLLHKHQMEAPPLPSSINPEIPPAVEIVVLRALEKDPNDRYATAGALFADFEHALDISKIARLSDGDRHTIEGSLAKPRPVSANARGSTPGKTPKSTQPRAKTASTPTAKNAPAKRQPTRLDLLLILGVIMALAVFLVVVAANLINRQVSPAQNQVVELPTLMVIPSSTPSQAGAANPFLTYAAVTTDLPNPLNTPQESGAPNPFSTYGAFATNAVVTTQESAPSPDATASPPRGAPPPPDVAIANDVAPLPEGVEPYTVDPLALDQARAAVSEQPTSPEAHLALIQAMIQTNQDGANIEQAIQAGLPHGDAGRYFITLTTIIVRNPMPPDIQFRIYNHMLDELDGEPLFEAVRERAGRHLYDLGSRRGLVPVFVLSAINNALNQEYHPLFFAMLGRLFITNDNLQLAEASLERAGEETHEVILVRGDLLAAQGDVRGARQLWEQLIADATTPLWIQNQAERKLNESGS